MSLPTAEELRALSRKPVDERLEDGYQYFKQKVLDFMPLLRVLPSTKDYQTMPEQLPLSAHIAKQYCKRFMKEEKTDIEIFYHSRSLKVVFNWKITEKKEGELEGELESENDDPVNSSDKSID